jgi:membrane protein
MFDPAPDASKQAVSRIAALQATAKTRTADATEWAARLRERSVIIEAAFVIYERDRVSAGSVLGSAIAFRLFLFFVPTIVFVVGLMGIFKDSAAPETVNETASVTGALAEQVRVALSQSSSAAYLTLATGLFLMVTAGRTLAKALVASSSLVWLTGGKVTVKVKVVAIIIGLLASMMLISLIINRIRNEFGIAAAGVSFGVTAVVYLVAFIVLMSVLPRRTHDPGALVPGAVLVSLVVLGMQAFSQLYLPPRLSGASELYGGIGVAVVTLGWLFVFGRVLAFSFAMNAALFDRFGSLSQALFALPVLRTLPRRSARIRRYFGLDAEGRSVQSSEQSDDVAIDAQLLTGIESLSDVERPADPD